VSARRRAPRTRPLSALALASLAAVALTAASPGALGAQAARAEPPRPRLAAGADTNDANAYHDYAMARETPWKKAYDAEYWAFRLDPEQPAYLYAQYLSLWYKQAPEWRIAYREGVEWAVKSKESRQLESLFYDATLRDPFVHLYSSVCYYPDWVKEVRNPAERAYVYFDSGCHREAALTFAEAIAKYPRRVSLRLDRARSSYWLAHYGNAITELRAALDTLRARDERRVVRTYESKEMLEYMLGAAYEREEDWAAAREAYGRALTENLSFHMAHAALAGVARRQGDMEAALQEYDLAVNLRPDDAVIRHEYGRALLDVQPRRNTEAEAQFRKVLELNPYYATAYFNLGVALDNQGRPAEATAQYQAYLARAPQSQGRIVAWTRTRIAALAQGGQ